MSERIITVESSSLLRHNLLRIFHANRTTKCQRYQGRTKGEGLSTANLLKPPSNFIAGRPKAALLFWFFGGFRCGVPLFIVLLVIY